MRHLRSTALPTAAAAAAAGAMSTVAARVRPFAGVVVVVVGLLPFSVAAAAVAVGGVGGAVAPSSTSGLRGGSSVGGVGIDGGIDGNDSSSSVGGGGRGAQRASGTPRARRAAAADVTFEMSSAIENEQHDDAVAAEQVVEEEERAVANVIEGEGEGEEGRSTGVVDNKAESMSAIITITWGTVPPVTTTASAATSSAATTATTPTSSSTSGGIIVGGITTATATTTTGTNPTVVVSIATTTTTPTLPATTSTTTTTATTTTATTATTDPCSNPALNAANEYQLISFVGMGDIPYWPEERYCLNKQLRDLDLSCACPSDCPSFVVHIGDIKRGRAPYEKCNDAAYRNVAEIFANKKNSKRGGYDPRDVFWTVGDNEWNDCPGLKPPLYAPAWKLWSKYFGPANPFGFGTLSDISIGGEPVKRQMNANRYGVVRDENFAFFRRGVLFVGVNNVGGESPGDEDVRLVQNMDWVEQNLEEYSSSSSSSGSGGTLLEALVVFGHAGIFDRSEDSDRIRKFGRPFLTLLKTMYPDLPALYFHGDTHTFRTSRPDPGGAPLFWDVEVEDGDRAPPLEVKVMKHDDALVSGAAVRFEFDDQEGQKYDIDAGCPMIVEKTWN